MTETVFIVSLILFVGICFVLNHIALKRHLPPNAQLLLDAFEMTRTESGEKRGNGKFAFPEKKNGVGEIEV